MKNKVLIRISKNYFVVGVINNNVIEVEHKNLNGIFVIPDEVLNGTTLQDDIQVGKAYTMCIKGSVEVDKNTGIASFSPIKVCNIKEVDLPIIDMAFINYMINVSNRFNS